MKQLQRELPGLMADFSSTWVTACMQPWTMWQGWAQLWGDPWRQWLDSVASMPSPWLPALAADRKAQPPAIDFFLPWLPRVEATVTPIDGHSIEDAMRIMLRAALPGVGNGAEVVLVDAKVARQKALTGNAVVEGEGAVIETQVVPTPVAPDKPAPARKPRVARAATKPQASAPVVAVSEQTPPKRVRRSTKKAPDLPEA